MFPVLFISSFWPATRNFLGRPTLSQLLGPILRDTKTQWSETTKGSICAQFAPHCLGFVWFFFVLDLSVFFSLSRICLIFLCLGFVWFFFVWFFSLSRIRLISFLCLGFVLFFLLSNLSDFSLSRICLIFYLTRICLIFYLTRICLIFLCLDLTDFSLSWIRLFLSRVCLIFLCLEFVRFFLVSDLSDFSSVSRLFW